MCNRDQLDAIDCFLVVSTVQNNPGRFRILVPKSPHTIEIMRCNIALALNFYRCKGIGSVHHKVNFQPG